MGWEEPTGRRRQADGAWSKPSGWRGRTRLDGEVTSSPVLTTRAQARRWWAEAETEHERGTRVDPRRGLLTVGDWADEWLASRGGLKVRTRDGYATDLRLHVLPALGHLPLASVTPVVVGRWAAELGRRRSAKTVHNVHGLLYSVMAAAVQERRVPANPCEGTSLPRVERGEPVFLSREDFDRLVRATPANWRPLLVTLGFTGLRWGEAAGLRGGRVDLATGVLHVVETLREDGGVLMPETPKSARSRRTVSLPAEIRRVLAPLVLAAGPGGHVFTGPEGGLLRRGGFARRVWHPAVAAAGLPRLRIHDLRHSHAAWLVAAGVPLLAVSRRLGHESTRTTEQVYGHLVPAVDAALLAALDTPAAASAPPLPHGDRPETAGEARAGL